MLEFGLLILIYFGKLGGMSMGENLWEICIKSKNKNKINDLIKDMFFIISLTWYLKFIDWNEMWLYYYYYFTCNYCLNMSIFLLILGIKY